jgi:hypothetical protein
MPFKNHFTLDRVIAAGHSIIEALLHGLKRSNDNGYID